MKTAIRKIGPREEKTSAEVLMAEEDYYEDPVEMVESILYGDSRRFYRGFDNRGYGRQRNQQNSQGNNSRGYQGGRGYQEAGGQRNYRKDYDGPRNQGYKENTWSGNNQKGQGESQEERDRVFEGLKKLL